jgi:hypothetical protein
MEWLILLLLVPAILVPVVLLCGFAGCKFDPRPVDTDPDPTTIISPAVQANPRNVDHIIVTWQNADPNHPALKYRFVRIKGTVTETDVEVDASVTTVDDTGLDAGTDYTYQVSTIAADGTSDPTAVTVGTFQTAFAVDPALAPTNQTLIGDNYCFVQRFPAALLLAGGSKVAIKVRGTPTGNVTINSIYISRAAGGNPWISAGDLTPVMTSPLTLTDDQPRDLDPIAYTLDKNQDLIIAFDFTATAAAGNIRFVPQPGVAVHFKKGVQQASRSVNSVPPRDADFSSSPNLLYLVVTIGVQ